MQVTIDRITIDLQQADGDQSPISTGGVRSVLIAELRRALAEVAARPRRTAAASAYRMDVGALDLDVDDPADLAQIARALAQRIAWLAERAGEGKGGQR
jgi:hypothetical protein